MSDPSATGRFVWYDLLTRDVAKAIPFYTAVARWGTEAFPLGDGPPYTMWTANGVPLGGVTTLPAGATGPHWMGHVSVADVDAAARQAQSLGGAVVSVPRDIPTVGRFAVIADPQGATIAIFTPLEYTPRTDTEPRIGEFGWHELATTDWKGALSFYTTLFGWDAGPAHDMGEMGTYQLFERHGIQLGGMFNASGATGKPAWLYYFRVASAADASKQVAQSGGRVLNGPMEVPGGNTVAQCTDVDGAAFAVMS